MPPGGHRQIDSTFRPAHRRGLNKIGGRIYDYQRGHWSRANSQAGRRGVGLHLPCVSREQCLGTGGHTHGDDAGRPVRRRLGRRFLPNQRRFQEWRLHLSRRGQRRRLASRLRRHGTGVRGRVPRALYNRRSTHRRHGEQPVRRNVEFEIRLQMVRIRGQAGAATRIHAPRLHHAANR